MGSRIRIILVFAGSLAVLFSFAAVRALTRHEQQDQPHVEPAVVRCVPLRTRKYTMTESFYGLLEAKSKLDMSFQIAGQIVQLGPDKDKPLREDDVVEEGQIIAMLDPARYEAAVEQSKAQMHEAQAMIAAADAEIADAEAWREDAGRELERIRKLHAAGSAHQREVDKADLQLKVNQAKLDSAKARRASAQATYNSAQAALTVAQVNLQDATLRAPMRGRVAFVPVKVGEMVQPGKTVMSLVDLSQVKLVIGVVERKLPLLKKGQKVRVQVEALSSQARMLRDASALAAPREGIVAVVPPAADPVTGLFNVEIELPNSDRLLKPGMVGRAQVSVMETEAFVIPADAAVRVGERAYAFFVGDTYTAGLNLGAIGKAAVNVPTTVARKIEFEPILFDSDDYLVAELPEGLNRLVVEGQERLNDGSPVRVVMDSVANAN